MLIVEQVLITDIEALKALQPDTWDDIIPRIIYFINSPHCIVLKTVLDGQIVGVGAVLFHKDSAWLANIITHEAHRNKGIGKLMTEALLASINKSIYTTIYLDATDLGYPVYLKFGFEVEGLYSHFKKDIDIVFETDSNINPYHERYYDAILNLDFKATSEYRSNKLHEGIADALIYTSEKKFLGVYFPTIGEGLILSHEVNAGIALMKAKSANASKAVIPTNNLFAADFLAANGYRLIKTSRRMRLGKKRDWNAALVFNRISGQLG